MIITGVQPCRAYVHHDLFVLFCTKPFSLDESTIGNNFDDKCHLSNYDINFRPSNYDNWIAQKGLVGSGSQWNKPMFEKYLKEHRKDISQDHIWQQIKVVAHHSAMTITNHSTVLQQKIITHRNDELIGIDMMLDENGKVWHLEDNLNPGLESTDSHL